jgi:hypothetical protein
MLARRAARAHTRLGLERGVSALTHLLYEPWVIA